MYDAREPLIQGAMYRVRVEVPGVFRVPRESCMKLLDVIDEGHTLVFSARPRLGTQYIGMDTVVDLECMPSDALVYVDWKVSSKEPPEKWKYER
jgi:hypothetical protein